MEKINADTVLYLLVIVSGSVDTGSCYALCDELKIPPVRGTARATECLVRGDITALKGALFNVMTEAAQKLNGRIRENLAAIEAVGGKAVMSGSGGTVFGVFGSEGARDAAFGKAEQL